MLSLLTATVIMQPIDATVCTGGVAVLTCVVDRNGANITSDDVMWEQIRMKGGISTLGASFDITTTISGDILTSTLSFTGAADNNSPGTSSYRCVVNDVMSRSAAIHLLTGKNS